jgi:hypothetical protein
MDVIPPLVATRFEQLAPGDIFLSLGGPLLSYGLKTKAPSSGDRCNFVSLGPQFVQGVEESFLFPWQSTAVLSFGTQCTIQLSTEPTAWFTSGITRKAVWLAVASQKIYVCCNGAAGPGDYFPCFVDVTTGEIVERRLPGTVAYTNTWELSVLGSHHPPRSVLKYPFVPNSETGKR